MTIIEAIIIAIVEGITEFLPISSTGHMIIAESFLQTKGDFVKLFTVAIQLGAILAVVVLYWKKFFDFTRWQFYAKLIVGVIPALVLGFAFNDAIEALLESPLTVAVSLLLGGVVLLFIDKWFKQPTKASSDILGVEVTNSEMVEIDENLSYKKSLIIGFWQVLAMIPGVSRSAASIIGGMQQKLTRSFAAEFSFFLAVPTMLAASAYSLVLKKWGEGGSAKHGFELIAENQQNLVAFIVGNVVAFVVALLAIKFFIKYLQLHGFRVFGIYRIVVGALLIVLISSGYLK